MNLANANAQHTPQPIAATGGFLARIDGLIDWAALETSIAAADVKGPASQLTAVKVALLKHWYGIADIDIEFALQDRLSFRCFVGFKGDGSAADASILRELEHGFGPGQPALKELASAVDGQLRDLGYAVSNGRLSEPLIVPCTTAEVEKGGNVDAGFHAGSTTQYRPGELGRMVEAVTAKAHAQGWKPAAPSATQHEAAAQDGTAVALGGGQTVQQADPIRAVLQWPWGESTDLTEHLNIGRDHDFSPLAHKLTPYTHVSRRHAELLVYGDGVWVRDLGSRNGTYVNNDEVPKGQAFLIDADSILRFGPLLAVSLKVVA